MELGLKIILSVFSFVLGSALASFCGVVAFRTPKKMSVVKPNSYCPQCGKPIKWYDNIPVVSYIVLGGKCRFCKGKIGAFGFLCELFCGVFFALAFWQFGLSVHTLLLFLLFALFVVVAQIDFDENAIYDVTLVIFAALALALGLWQMLWGKTAVWWDFLVGSAVGFGFFGLIKLVAEFVLKKDALGSGDVYLSGIAGFMLGIFPLLLGITVATLIGSIVELLRIKLNKSQKETHVAFAPYLLFGFAVAAIFGRAILNWLEVVI